MRKLDYVLTRIRQHWRSGLICMSMTGDSITIIDDDEAVRHSLQALLEAAGHSVEVYATGEDFLAASGPSACLILDLHLPGLDGIEVMERLRQAGVTTPVILVSARFDAATRARAARAGAAAVLEKPLRERTLLDGIARCMAAAPSPADACLAV